MNTSGSSPPVFVVGSFCADELGVADVPALQRFFEQNPEYFQAVNGQPPAPDEAQHEFTDLPPADMPFSRRWVLRITDESGRWVGMAGVLSDFLVPRVWHIGLFIVASELHGTGTSRQLYDALEAWMLAAGAAWVRLGVVQGNAKAERFWSTCGYVQVRQRGPVEMGLRSNLLRVMVKPLASGTLADYGLLVARDRPE